MKTFGDFRLGRDRRDFRHPLCPPATAWYEGGTLHQGTLADWRRATVANRLATAGDMVYVLLTRQGEQNLDLAQIRVMAEAMVAGVDEMAKDDTLPDDAAISEIIALIWLASGVE